MHGLLEACFIVNNACFHSQVTEMFSYCFTDEAVSGQIKFLVCLSKKNKIRLGSTPKLLEVVSSIQSKIPWDMFSITTLLLHPSLPFTVIYIPGQEFLKSNRQAMPTRRIGE